MPLDRIASPADLKKLSIQELDALSSELRKTIIERVALNGGHLASNLGAIELAVGLHYVFDSPTDKIIWDVGHQSYAHKLLTGRYKDFPGLRKHEGISGFPKRDESVHDHFGTGHSSTSISAALGIIEGRDGNRESFNVIAVIGDGALTAGLAFEGLNYAGHLKKDLLIILNDNAMSISENVGALSSHLNSLQMSAGKGAVGQARQGHGVLFEELGFLYSGPIDGHDISKIVNSLEGLRKRSGPAVLHVITQKGKGYEFSEKRPSYFHGVGPFDIKTGKCAGGDAFSYSEAFGNALAELAETDEKIIAITAAMKEGTGLERFAERFPDRFHDAGIAESHAVAFAAGLATQGQKPVVAIYSTFLQRGYDQLIHDVCLQDLGVVFAIDRAGIVGEDGPTHGGLFDISYLRCVPNLVVMAPKDDAELKEMLRLALERSGPSAIRYPRGKVKAGDRGRESAGPHFAIGEAEVLRNGDDIALIAIGSTVEEAALASGLLEDEGINATVVNARFAKPLDENLLLNIAGRIKRIITIEDNVTAGGFGSAVLELLAANQVPDIRVKLLGIQDLFVEQGTQKELRSKYRIDGAGICQAALDMLEDGAFICQ